MLIDYETLRAEVEAAISAKGKMVLATSKNDRVTARTMSVVNFGLTIYFQTDSEFLKYEQMLTNPNVALCFDNVQIEGKVYNEGRSYAEKNEFFREQYRKIHPGSFAAYSHLQTTVLFRVEPQLVTLWKYQDGKPHRWFLDIVNKCARLEEYATD
ncbi:MAG: pyridoxamine 5'-phosphate oxidase family protein [Bacillota bacterium]